MKQLLLLAILLSSYISAYKEIDLLNSMKERDTAQVKKILQSNPALKDSKIDLERSAPLHIAVFTRNKELIDFLINADSNLNIKNLAEETPLHVAVSIGNAYIVQLLLNAGAQSNIKDNKGRTPLHYAAKRGDIKIIYLLINAGADINAQDDTKNTPLDLAIMDRKKDTIRLLLSQPSIILKEQDSTTKNPLSLTQSLQKYWQNKNPHLALEYQDIGLLIKQAIKLKEQGKLAHWAKIQKKPFGDVIFTQEK